MDARDPLREVPDWLERESCDWVSSMLDDVRRCDPAFEEGDVSVVEGSAVGAVCTPLGRFVDERWRRFVSACFVADWSAYPEGPTRVEFDRLAFVVHRYPEGFRVWFVRGLPVGYFGWYPMSEATYRALTVDASGFSDRAVLPFISEGGGVGRPAYLFNYSVAPQFKGTTLSRSLLRALAADLRAVGPRALAAMTVSEDGARVAKRFGLTAVGAVTNGSITEDVYAGQYLSSQ